MQKSLNKILDHKYSPFKGAGGRAYFALFNICFIWGTTWNVLRLGKDYLHPLQLAGIRQTLAGLFFISYFLIRKHGLPSRQQLWQAFYLSFFMFVFSNGLSSWAMKYINAGLGAIIGALSPLVMTMMGMMIGKQQQLSKQTIAGLLLGMLGIVIIFYEHLHDLMNPQFRMGLMFSGIAVLTWSFGSVIIANRQKNVNPYYSVGWQMFFAGIMMSMWSYASGYSIPLANIPWKAWAIIGYLVLFGSVITFVSYVYALKKLPVAQVSIYAYVNPIIAISIGALFMNEKITAYIITGTLITLSGVYLVNRTMQQKAKEIIEEADHSQ